MRSSEEEQLEPKKRLTLSRSRRRIDKPARRSIVARLWPSVFNGAVDRVKSTPCQWAILRALRIYYLHGLGGDWKWISKRYDTAEHKSIAALAC